MQNLSLQVCDGNMLLLPFQSGCEARIQMARTRAVSRCNDSCDSVMYGRATQTSVTVVFKFPRKTWGAKHTRTVDTRHSSPIFFIFFNFFRAPGNDARCVSVMCERAGVCVCVCSVSVQVCECAGVCVQVCEHKCVSVQCECAGV